MNGKLLISFVVSLSNHKRNLFVQHFPNQPNKAIAKLVYKSTMILYYAMPCAETKKRFNRVINLESLIKEQAQGRCYPFQQLLGVKNDDGPCR